MLETLNHDSEKSNNYQRQAILAMTEEEKKVVESKFELYKELHFTRCTLYVLNRDVGYSYSQNLTYWRARGGEDIIYGKVF